MSESTQHVSSQIFSPSSQPQSISQEMARKAFHSFVLSIPIGYHIFQVPLGIVVLVFVVILLLYVPIELARLKIPNFFLNRVVRKSEENKIANYVPTTIVWFGLALGAYLDIYPFEYAEAAIIATVIGDAAAALIGKSFGTHQLMFTQKKTVEGAVAGFLVTWAISSAFLALVRITFAPILGLGIALVFLLTDLRENPPTDLLCDNILNPILGTIVVALTAAGLAAI